jgi:hypothetical protein
MALEAFSTTLRPNVVKALVAYGLMSSLNTGEFVSVHFSGPFALHSVDGSPDGVKAKKNEIL